MTPAREDGDLVLLLVDDATGTAYAGTEAAEELAPARSRWRTAYAAAEGYDVLTGAELVGIDQELTRSLPAGEEDSFIRPEGLSGDRARAGPPPRRHRHRVHERETGAVFSDNGRGSYATPTGETLEQGWRVGVGFDNFKRIFNDPLVRDPFLSVFLWTFVYAGVSVLLTFALGLFLAVTLNKSGLRLRRTQQALWSSPTRSRPSSPCSSGAAC